MLHLLFFDLLLRLFPQIYLVPNLEHCVFTWESLDRTPAGKLLLSRHAQNCLREVGILINFALVTFLMLYTIVLVDCQNVDSVIIPASLGSSGLMTMLVRRPLRTMEFLVFNLHATPSGEFRCIEPCGCWLRLCAEGGEAFGVEAIVFGEEAAMVVARFFAGQEAADGEYEIIIKLCLRFKIELVLQGVLWISFLHLSILFIL